MWRLLCRRKSATKTIFLNIRASEFNNCECSLTAWRRLGYSSKYYPWQTDLKFVVKVKVKCTLVQALRLCTSRTAHTGSRGIALLFHDHNTRRGWGVSVTPRPFFTSGKTRYLLYRRLGGPQGRSGQVRKIWPPPGFDPRTVQPVASRYTDWATWSTKFVVPLN